MLYNWWQHTFFAYPWLLPLLLIVPYLVYWHWKSDASNSPRLLVSTTGYFRPPATLRWRWRKLPFALRCLAIAAMIIALARPQEKFVEEQFVGEGIDIILCFDISGSMTGNDFPPTRLAAAKDIATEFVESRGGDRIGVVIFSSQSFTLCPLTTDHHTVLSQINAIENGYLTEDGTAIGSGLATSVDRLKSSTAKSKVVILLTDGVDFGGVIPPDIAEKLAKAYGIKVYCVGIGTKMANTDTTQPGKFGFDDNLLKNISLQTGGLYFQANDREGLQKSYATISQLEKSKIETTTYSHYTESFLPFILIAIVCLLLEISLRLTVFKTFP